MLPSRMHLPALNSTRCFGCCEVGNKLIGVGRFYQRRNKLQVSAIERQSFEQIDSCALLKEAYVIDISSIASKNNMIVLENSLHYLHLIMSFL